MKPLVVLIGLLASASVAAQQTLNGGLTGNIPSANTAIINQSLGIAGGGAGGTAKADANGIGNGYGGSGTGGNGGDANNAGNDQNVIFKNPQQSPTMIVYAPPPTAPCQASIGGFLSFIGGIGIAGSRTLEECEIRESSRIAHGVGQPEIAKEILCMGKYAAQTEMCKKLKGS